MGTTAYFMEMLPAADGAVRTQPDAERFVEVLTVSGPHQLVLAIGPVGEEHPGDGPRVTLSKEAANRLLEGLQGAMRYLGYLE